MHHLELVNHPPRARNLAAEAQYPEQLSGIRYDSLQPNDAISGSDRDVVGEDPRVLRQGGLHLPRDLLVGGPRCTDDHFLETRIRLPLRMLGRAVAGRSEERRKENCNAGASAANAMSRDRRCGGVPLKMTNFVHLSRCDCRLP